ncbi:MAG: transporter substrate-binding domain-containing protein [Ruminococcaceae bacterium]|nr:transporter substrate-binding domain-containing protein [Oscillospiraceae bacterium]HHV32129.1 transporter substrate-binding domain-containing protein [Clostridiales bacterium]
MKKGSKLAAIVLAVAMAVSMGACSSAGTTAASSGASSAAASTTIDKIKADGYITMSTNAEFEPFEYKDGDKVTGIDVEIAQKVADKLGVQLKVNDIAFDTLITELNSGKSNFVAAGMSVTEDRQKNVDFSDTYFDASQAIIVTKDSPIKLPSDLNGKKVGVQQGTTGDTYCTNEDGKNDIKVSSVERYNKGVDAVADLMNGKIDAVVIDSFPATKFVEKNSDKLVKLNDALTVEKYAIAVKKGDKEMLDTINNVLSDMKSSGELDKIIEKYKAALGA